jgi:hypothetical protein
VKRTATGWFSSYDVLLNAQCVACRVWVGFDGKRLVEFDGMPHRCTPRQRQVTLNATTNNGDCTP